MTLFEVLGTFAAGRAEIYFEFLSLRACEVFVNSHPNSQALGLGLIEFFGRDVFVSSSRLFSLPETACICK